MIAFNKEIYKEDGYCHNIYKIYVLKHPITSEIFYVGQTRKALDKRLYGHIKVARGDSSKFANVEKDNYIKSLLSVGLKPKIKAIQFLKPVSLIEYLEVGECEVAWMKKLFSEGHPLLNVLGLRVPILNAKYLYYKEQLAAKSVDLKYYYCGKDEKGNNLYHKERILQDGGAWIDDKVPIINSYNPFENPRFLKKMGML